ncbi:MAG: response regulator [Crocosphaera sp.]
MNSLNFEPEAPLIFIVDDDRTMRSLLRIAMEEEGYRVIEAKNGQQCLDEYGRWQPDIVLLDAIMPEMDGFTCCQKLRSLEDNCYLPILMITALDDQDSIEQAFAAGATDYITKPIFWSVLSQRVRHLLFTSQAFKQLQTVKSQLARQEQWQQICHQISNQWQQSVKLKSLFNHSLNKLQTLVNAERVGIHNINGTLMAEAISSGYPSVKILEWQKITLFTTYQNTYQRGEEVIIDFSEDTGLSEEAIAPLQQLSIKTLILIPLLVKKNLWGILWIHHCRSSYVWESWEVEYLGHLRDLLVITSLVSY